MKKGIFREIKEGHLAATWVDSRSVILVGFLCYSCPYAQSPDLRTTAFRFTHVTGCTANNAFIMARRIPLGGVVQPRMHRANFLWLNRLVQGGLISKHCWLRICGLLVSL